MKPFALLLLLLGAAATGVRANNIQISNVTLAGQNTTNQTTQVRFDLSWENSWRISAGPANYDAAWVFVKFRVNGDTWNHATLGGGVPVAGAAIDVTADGVGAFIYRDADGSGDISWTGLELQWDYGADGVDDNALVDIQVFAVEMVYVPEGTYQLGISRSLTDADPFDANHFFEVPQAIFGLSAYTVTSEAAIPVNAGIGTLSYVQGGGGSPGDGLGPIPVAFPKGFAAFYCMKYETSQDQWVSFFNTLTPTQKSALDITGADGKNSDNVVSRNGVSWTSGGTATTSLPNVPVNYVVNTYMLAYLDWAGLRPMTEMEYEKAGRGPLAPVRNGFAWGTTNIHNAGYTLASAGTEFEVISNPGAGTGNTNYLSTNGGAGGPFRCGIFAASALLNNREETGGSYYGIMELTGNVYERTISVGNPEGRAFTGQHGDGAITAGGVHNVTGWPGTNTGIGYRGGSYANSSIFLRLSDRYDGATNISGGNARIGFRGVRTAP